MLPLLALPVLLAPTRPAPEARLAELERRSGGRLCFAALETGTGRWLEHRGDTRFTLCSTFKVLLAGAVLARVDAGRLSLEQKLAFGAGDLVDHAPVCRARAAEGALTLGDLCAATLQVSDNTAANLLMRHLGGPGAVTAYVRSLDDPITRLDRYEPELNRMVPGDLRDTSTARAMVGTLRVLFEGKALSPASQARLRTWMAGATTGLKRLRAGFPAGWTVLNKSGGGFGGNPTNDVALVRPLQGAPILVAVSLTDGQGDREAVLAEAARIVAEAWPQRQP